MGSIKYIKIDKKFKKKYYIYSEVEETKYFKKI